MDVGKYSHNTTALYDLHWLPIHASIHFKILLLAFKVIPRLAPAYLYSLVSVKSKSHYSLRSNCSTLLDPPNGKMLVTLGGRSFQAAVPQLWNALPSRLREVTSVGLFKKAFADRFTLIKIWELLLFSCTCYIYDILLIIFILISVVRFNRHVKRF